MTPRDPQGDLFADLPPFGRRRAAKVSRPIRRHAALFSTPLELGLRAVIVLDAVRPTSTDLQRLVAYDYLLVHSGDAQGPESVHPSTPHRSAEILVKRDVLRNGLLLMLSRSLIDVDMSPRGVRYAANDLTPLFLDHLEGDYASQLRTRARWLRERFSLWSDEQLQSLIARNIDKWGGEFTSEALVRHVAV